MGKQHDELVDWSRRNWDQVAKHVIGPMARSVYLVSDRVVELILADGRTSIDLYFEFVVDWNCNADAEVRRQEDWEAELRCADNHGASLDEDVATNLYAVDLEAMLPKQKHYYYDGQKRPEYPWRPLGPKRHACLFPHSLVCEIKPEIVDAGATLRQVKQYVDMLRYKTDPASPREAPSRRVFHHGIRYDLRMPHSAVIVTPDERWDDLMGSQPGIGVFHPPGFGRRPVATTTRLDSWTP